MQIRSGRDLLERAHYKLVSFRSSSPVSSRTTSASERRRILALALPIIGGMLSQNVLNLVDMAMVGSLGDNALAAVGVGGFATLMSVALFMGFSSAVQAIASRRVGQDRRGESAHPLNAAILLCLVAGVPALLGLLAWAPWLIGKLTSDPSVAAVAVPYYRLRVMAVIAIGINLAFSGFWNGTDRSRFYMATLWVMHACNVVLNYAFIYGKFGAPALGAPGAALGTALSLYLGTAIFFWLGWKEARHNGFLERLPSLREVRVLIRLLLPGGFQQLFFWAGMTALLAIVDNLGTTEVAATNVLLNLVLVVVLIQVGFGLAAGTLAGQSLGAGRVDNARHWVSIVIRFALAIMVPVAVMVAIVPQLFLSPFIQEAQTLSLAANPLRIVAIAFVIDCFGVIYLNALQGVGDHRMVMFILAGCQWLIFLPLAYLLGPILGLGLEGVWMSHLLYRAAQAWILHKRWGRDAWTRHQF